MRAAVGLKIEEAVMTMIEKRAEAGNGISASLAGSTAMSAMLGVTHKLGLLGEPPPRKLMRKMTSFPGMKKISRGVPLEIATAAGHYGYGAGIGALFGGALASRTSSRAKRIGLGMATGALAWAVSYKGGYQRPG